MTTILDALKNAQINFNNVIKMNHILKEHPIFCLAKNQLENALEALEKGGKLNDDISEYIEDVF